MLEFSVGGIGVSLLFIALRYPHDSTLTNIKITSKKLVISDLPVIVCSVLVYRRYSVNFRDTIKTSNRIFDNLSFRFVGSAIKIIQHVS